MPQAGNRSKSFTIQPKKTEWDGIRALADALRLARGEKGNSTMRYDVSISVADRKVTLPSSIAEMLENVTRSLAAGDDVTILPKEEELTTGEAAKLLNVSRQYLVRLCDEEKLPCRKEGTHRRLSVKDVLAFKEQRDEERSAMFRQLITDAFEDGEYDEQVTWPPQ
jgi:excisionase family DNA binding protein